MSLIDNSSSIDPRPLADRLRPETLADYIGQQHLMAADKPLGGLASKGQIHSMILWGPPGTGKTTLAKILATSAGCKWISISAVLSGVKDIRQAVEQAEYYLTQGEKTVLFVDEVHRFNKSQQDAFLPHVEKGTVTFIGATTENPSFEVNAALLSRARVYVLRGLLNEDLVQVVQRGAQALGLEITPDAQQLLIASVDGDARRCLNILEIAGQLGEGTITDETIAAASGERMRRFDKGGDLFYEQISALHKSIRGSAPDAAIYWFCRMLDGGADPRYIGRRLIRLASEDVGNADPRALELTLAAVSSFERLGKPEGELALAQAVLYLASVPKSDAAYKAFSAAKAFVAQSPTLEVPMHLRNAATGMMKGMGYGEGYRHAHAETSIDGAYAAGEDYFPEAMQPQQFYFPRPSGLEDKIKNRLERLRELDAQAVEQRREDS
ncbi:MAG: replication-associated recombination protein A [Gammaproteobacteria bacterium]|jgi:putative ATPase|nr:replication-associated recombination protein A [Gammaproteobacteria bacterium]MBT5682736.1 replication-associated recombination protein A [Gammaproteobacteria bacterium]MBT6025246.1 replication-associated recombination protein A [Gammaproteobacteria bacterium]